MAFACRASLPSKVSIKLVGPTLLRGLNRRAKKLVSEAMREKRVEYIAQRVENASKTSNGYRITLINGSIEKRISCSGLQMFAHLSGWPVLVLIVMIKALLVDESMQCIGDGHIFVAGDAAHLQGQERAKAGVFAVRAASVLAANLARAVQGLPLHGPRSRFSPQESFLTLIGLGAPDRPDAIAVRGVWALRGKIFWRLKNWIDQRFIHRYNELPSMDAESVDLPESLAGALPDDAMRCGGCGAKLASDPLRRVLQRPPTQSAPHVNPWNWRRRCRGTSWHGVDLTQR